MFKLIIILIVLGIWIITKPVLDHDSENGQWILHYGRPTNRKTLVLKYR